jgi:hypothetical protein
MGERARGKSKGKAKKSPKAATVGSPPARATTTDAGCAERLTDTSR